LVSLYLGLLVLLLAAEEIDYQNDCDDENDEADGEPDCDLLQLTDT
jgi:hypothetical protein